VNINISPPIQLINESILSYRSWEKHLKSTLSIVELVDNKVKRKILNDHSRVGGQQSKEKDLK